MVSFSSRSSVMKIFMCICVLIVSIGLFINVRTANAAQICNTGGSIPMGKYWLNSNLWGASSGSGTQCISDVSNTPSSIAWNTSWSWTGQSNSVKSYDSSVLGWHWGWQNSNTGLPIQLSSNKGVQTGWNFNLTQNNANTQDISYDLWLHTIGNPTSSSAPSDEVMVWLYRSGGAGPVGTKQATVTIDGTSWDLYEGNIGWEVHSFVRTTNTNSSTLDLKDFLNYLVTRGLSSSKYLSSVESGTEIFTGSGQLNTTSYYANVVTEGSGGGSTPTPTPTPTTGGGSGFNPNPASHYRIVNRNSGQALDVSGWSTADGGLIDQWTSTGGANQLWSFTGSNGGYKVINVNSGKLLDDPAASKTSGTQLDQWSDNNGSNQLWNVVSAGNGYYYLVNQSSGEYADVSSGSTTAGAAVIQWTSDGGTNQQWSLVQVS